MSISSRTGAGAGSLESDDATKGTELPGGVSSGSRGVFAARPVGKVGGTARRGQSRGPTARSGAVRRRGAVRGTGRPWIGATRHGRMREARDEECIHCEVPKQMDNALVASSTESRYMDPARREKPPWWGAAERLARWLLVGPVVLILPVSSHGTGLVHGFRGHWTVRSYEHCWESTRPTEGGFDCRSAGRDLTITDRFKADAEQGKAFRFRERTVYTEHGVSGYPPPACTSSLHERDNSRAGGVVTVIAVPVHLYTWQCVITSHGTGFFRLGYTHLTDFWISRETATFRADVRVRRGRTPRQVPAAPVSGSVHPADVGYPAVLERYGTRRVLRCQWLSRVATSPGAVRCVTRRASPSAHPTPHAFPPIRSPLVVRPRRLGKPARALARHCL